MAVETAPLRVGIIVPLHGHSAVERNRVKRRLREIVRLRRSAAVLTGTMVVFALPSAYGASFEELGSELTELCQRVLR